MLYAVTMHCRRLHQSRGGRHQTTPADRTERLWRTRTGTRTARQGEDDRGNSSLVSFAHALPASRIAIFLYVLPPLQLT